MDRQVMGDRCERWVGGVENEGTRYGCWWVVMEMVVADIDRM